MSGHCPPPSPFRSHNIKTKSRHFPAEPLPVSANIAIFLSNSEYHRTFSFSDSQDRRAALCLFKQSVELDTVVDVGGVGVGLEAESGDEGEVDGAAGAGLALEIRHSVLQLGVFLRVY